MGRSLKVRLRLWMKMFTSMLQGRWPIKSVYPPPYTLDSYNIQNCMDDPALEHFFEEERKENEEES